VERHGHVALERVDRGRVVVQALELAPGEGNRREIAPSLVGLAAVAAAEGEPERAARLLGAAQGLLDALGAAMRPIDCTLRERTDAAARADLPASTFEAAWSEGRAMALEQAVAYALDRTPPESPMAGAGTLDPTAGRHPA
jgi:hypothetical protein